MKNENKDPRNYKIIGIAMGVSVNNMAIILLPKEAIHGEQHGYYTTAVPGTLASAVSRGEGVGKQAVKL